ncbi:hypothetical protein [Arenibacter troitsensis]|uniref:Uncharacterized protein n=1 Tax=Arenibacter troitsensis TaxID=188872 RepID=A0A1X7K7P6_9FLAO|nr:hypothetical protein [Arenibacter troitsensis]MDX1767509.1 hypothetical protein [Arenibacter troitsensis]SMG36425.1 hypothetical protein SAMN03080602_02498 [Arenibacter troitsensis]
MKRLILGMLLFSVFPFMAQEVKKEVPPNEIQIKTAVLPAPDEKKDGAMVYGYNSSGELEVLRKGTNNLVCIGDNPSKDGINVACYSKKLEPFMARGRELSAQDLSGEEREKIRAKEVASGKLKMPKEPSMMYVYYGKSEDYDITTGELQNGKFRYVIYTPFATTESTGLPDKPHAPGMPWLMDPGTHRAHIMVGPFD